jgi:hypothetical protein
MDVIYRPRAGGRMTSFIENSSPQITAAPGTYICTCLWILGSGVAAKLPSCPADIAIASVGLLFSLKTLTFLIQIFLF